jgi:hypothetical protein
METKMETKMARGPGQTEKQFLGVAAGANLCILRPKYMLASGTGLDPDFGFIQPEG